MKVVGGYIDRDGAILASTTLKNTSLTPRTLHSMCESDSINLADWSMTFRLSRFAVLSRGLREGGRGMDPIVKQAELTFKIH